MLTSIEDLYRDEALVLLRWLAYAQSPPTLAQLAEAAIIDPSGGGSVDTANRGQLEDTLEILSGFVVVQEADIDSDSDFDRDEASDTDTDETTYPDHTECEGTSDGNTRNVSTRNVRRPSSRDIDSTTGSRLSGSDGSSPGRRVDTKIRLAHFSIQEYLESDRILQTAARGFHLSRTEGHSYLAQCCLVYVLHYCKSPDKLTVHNDREDLPLLEYAACSWIDHLLTSPDDDTTIQLATKLLGSQQNSLSWASIVHPHQILPYDCENIYGSGLYYASAAGLNQLVKSLLHGDSDVNAQRGPRGSALMAAAYHGHKSLVRMLIARGANLHTNIGYYGNALQMASAKGREQIVWTLLQVGADVNAAGGYYGNALQAASCYKHVAVAEMLLKHEANANAQGGYHGSALQAAAYAGHREIVRILLDAGADPNLHGGLSGNALHAAVSSFGVGSDMQRLLMTVRGSRDNENEVKETACVLQIVQSVRPGRDGTSLPPLPRDLSRDHEELVAMLLKAGADVNARGGRFNDNLRPAAACGHEKLVAMLIAAGADVNAQGGYLDNALNAALSYGHNNVAKMLVDAGALASAPGSNLSGGDNLDAQAE